jgi:hypothetical protein
MLASPTRRHLDRRRFARFVVEPMYTPIAARVQDDGDDGPFNLEGHAYDISEGGMRFELDRPVEPGRRIAIRIFLPGTCERDEGRSVLVEGRVVWLEDADQPGPCRLAVVFTHFARAGDRDRLIRHFGSGRYRLAA